MTWTDAQKWEAGWWGDCLNTFGEEEKQILYAKRMGLQFFHDKKSPYNIDMKGKTVVDIGGGPTSLLLKCHNIGPSWVIDPLKVPEWVRMRYDLAGLHFAHLPAEKMDVGGFHEAWIYNCLQHTQKPRLIIDNALKSAGIVRIFEWIDTVKNEGHPHAFTAPQLDTWLGGEGKIETLNGQANCYGKCYFGIFVGTGLDDGDS